MRLILWFSIQFIIGQHLIGQTLYTKNRSDLDPLAAPFFHGVASGDPTSSSVVLWTRITNNEELAEVFWEVSTDTLLMNVLANGSTTTTSDVDFTVNVLVENLPANAWLYYRFSHNGIYSPIGRTRTAPDAGVENLRFAVMACSNYQDGYFNAYRDVVTKNDVDAILHLGDYIYEYGIDDFSPGGDTSRLHDPDEEILNLEDYRIRHSQYKLDRDLQELHRQYPVIAVWDDHETANNSWMGGAENHTEGAEGNWEARKNDGKRAYFEWMPMRETNGSIKRTFSWGSLVDLIMIDTRLEGRQEQAGTSGAQVTDTNRTLLGAEQLEWFKSNLSQSNAQWKIIGNQVMVSPLRIFGNPVNEDQWDGYPAEREKILKHIEDNSIDNCVFLTGDIHTSWANDIPRNLNNYDASTGAGSVAVEYVCTSVTSSSFLTFGVPVQLIQVFNPNVKYADLSKRGYLLLDINASRVQGDWVHLNTIGSANFQSEVSASWRCLNGENHLEAAPQPLSPRGTNAPLAPPPNYLTTKGEISSAPVIISCNPNPFTDRIGIQYYAMQAGKVNITVSDLSGKVFQSISQTIASNGLQELVIPTFELSEGVYLIHVETNNAISSYKMVKMH
jgi:alkaline phosphatase D